MRMISEVMTRDVRFVAPRESLQRAAQMMDELNVGALPVCDGERLVGMITDRDITVRATSAGKAPGATCVEDAMSADVRWCFEDQPLDEVMIQMADSQIRRIPVVSRDNRQRLVGIIALGDVATKSDGGQKQDAEDTLETVSRPSSGPGKRYAGTDEIAGRRGEGGAGQASAGAESRNMAGVDLPHAGQNEMGAGGAAGDPNTRAPGGGGRSGATGDPRRNFGVGGNDLQGDGSLPPH